MIPEERVNKQTLIRTGTVSVSLKYLLKGQLRYLNSYFRVIAAAGDKEKLLNDIKKTEGVETKEIKICRQISPLNDVISLIRLIILFYQERPIIVHSITPKAGLLSMFAAKLVGVPIRMHTFTGLIFPSKKGFLRRILIWMDKLLCWSATSVYPEGEGVKKDLINYKITKKPLKILANGNVNGIDLKYFNPLCINTASRLALRDQLCIPADSFIWIFIGRMVVDKGMVELINAFKKLDNKSYLLMVGDFESKLSPLPATTMTHIQNNQRIKHVGFQEDIRPFLAISDSLILPSYREGFPNVVLQAGAFGKPCIVTNINGSNEIIKHGFNGLIVKPKNTEDLLEKMTLLSSDERFLRSMSDNCREHIFKFYRQDYVWSAILSEYRFQLETL